MPSKSILIMHSLSLTERAALELTNDSYVGVRRQVRPRHAVLTSKDVYNWAPLLALLAESTRVSPEQLELAVASSLRRWSEIIEHDVSVNPPGGLQQAFIVQKVLEELAVEDAPELLKRFGEEARLAYQSLLGRGLVEDPQTIVIAGFALTVLGLIPTSFTCKTKAGQIVSRRIAALYWKYEQSERAGVVTTTVDFRLWKFLKAFRQALSAAMENDEL